MPVPLGAGPKPDMSFIDLDSIVGLGGGHCVVPTPEDLLPDGLGAETCWSRLVPDGCKPQLSAILTGAISISGLQVDSATRVVGNQGRFWLETGCNVSSRCHFGITHDTSSGIVAFRQNCSAVELTDCVDREAPLW
jgi:hypothetical protein